MLDRELNESWGNGCALICVYCNGKGYYPVSTNRCCPVCSGKGTLPFALCRQCIGLGKIAGGVSPCPNCKGQGFIILETK